MTRFTDRDYAIIAARGLVANGTLVIDTETSGLGKDAEVVEVAIVEMSGHVLMNTLVRPTRSIPDYATDLHGIRNADVEHEPGMLDLWPIITGHIRSRNIVTYNANFDGRMLLQGARLAGVDNGRLDACAITCAMDLYASFYGQFNDRRRRYTWQTLDNACRQQGIALPPGCRPHRALSDAEATRLLLHHVAAQAVEGE